MVQNDLMLVARENTPFILPLIADQLENLIEKFPLGDCSFPQVVYDLQTAHRQLWILPTSDNTIQGWMITKIENCWNHQKTLVLDLMGGEDIDSLLPHLDYIEAWGASLGASSVRALSRPGFKKKLRAQGFRHVCDMVEKPLKGRLH